MLRAGAVLRERTWKWTSWPCATRRGAEEDYVSRAIDPLREVAFIARVGILPPRHLDRFHDFDWTVTPHGVAWRDANLKLRVTKQGK